MIDIKQLKYFIVCADVGSFSVAASILYTTQSSVSKVIMTLEKEMGTRLFTRNPHGITLTPQGKAAYRKASRIIENVEELKEFSRPKDVEWLNIVCNPSSWLSNRFVEFYNLYENEKLHCQVHTANVSGVMKRLSEYRDEIGFVYVYGSLSLEFQYALSRNHLEFHTLKELGTMLYLGRKHPLYQADSISQSELNELAFIQNYSDEFGEYSKWNLKAEPEKSLDEIDIRIITNSDYIMEKMLAGGRLANVSGNYLTDDESSAIKNGFPLENEKSRIYFGYMKRAEEELGGLAQRFLAFIEKALEVSDGGCK